MDIIPIVSHYLFDVNSYLLKSGQEFFLIDSGITKKRTQIEGELR